MNKFYLTCAIPYVNAPPHIGHALEFVQTDTLARLNRLLDKKTLFLTGADENSLKNVQAAEEKNISPQKLCNQNSKKFQDLLKLLNISVDVFQRGTNKTHRKGSQKLWQLCFKNGDIYKKNYSGLYCLGCEAFLEENELENGLCPEHLKKPELVKEENYFFRLSKYQDFLHRLISTNQLEIIPITRKNEVLAFIKKGLKDFSISRSKKRAKNWGIPVPNDPSQVIYVWFDALNIYQTGIGFSWNEKKYKSWWPADLHVIGKGISRFHAIYWPAILKSAHLKLPKKVFIHGYVTIEGQKMSKSLGNIINPIELIHKFGADSLRYYLLREIPPYNDGDFSFQRFKQVYNADLANSIGNLVSRVSTLCQKSNFDFPRSKTSLEKKVQSELKQFKFNQALEFLLNDKKSGVCAVDKFVNETKPWKLKGKALHKNLLFAVSFIRNIAYNLQPFLPNTSQKILNQFKGPKIKAARPLFPRLN